MKQATPQRLLKMFQWLFRWTVILSALVAIVVNSGKAYQYLPKQLLYGAGIWFFWYSLPVLLAVFVALSMYWQILKQNLRLKGWLPMIDMWFLLVYILLWFLYRFFILRIGF